MDTDIAEKIWKFITIKQKLVVSVALLVFIVFVVNPFYTVDEGQRVVVKTFGEVSSIAVAGAKFCLARCQFSHVLRHQDTDV